MDVGRNSLSIRSIISPIVGVILLILIAAVSLIIGVYYGYLSLNLVRTMLSFSVFAMTLTIVVIAYVEEFQRPKRKPVVVEPIDSGNLDDGEFAFHVENRTGIRISGGSRFAVMPRDLTKNGESLDLYRFNQVNVQRYLLGDDNALKNAMNNNCPMYCHSPASQTDDWRGPWATYLPSEGGDRKKRISTHPFPIYRIMAQSVLNNVMQERNRHDLLEERVQSLVDEYNNQLPDDAEEDFSIEYDSNELVDCVTDCIFPNLNVQDAEEMSVILRNILTCDFKKEDDGWKADDISDHSI